MKTTFPPSRFGLLAAALAALALPLPAPSAHARAAPVLPASLPGCPGDLDGNGTIDSTDLNIVLSAFGCSGSPGECLGDANGDGNTDSIDLNIVLSTFGSLCPCPPLLVNAPDDLAFGSYTPDIAPSFADLNSDGIVDLVDLIFHNLLFTGPDVLPPGHPAPDQAWPVPVTGDFDGDNDIDSDDTQTLFNEMDSPPASSLLIIASSTAPPSAAAGVAPGMTYRIDGASFSMTGVMQDPINPSVSVQFDGYGAVVPDMARHAVPTPVPATDPFIVSLLSDAAVDPDTIAQLQNLTAGQNIVEIGRGVADLTGPVLGEAILLCNDTPKPDIVVQDLFPYAMDFVFAATDTGTVALTVRARICPGDCAVSILNCPVCVCNGCSYTLVANGVWPGGSYLWEVIEGADKTNPDTFAGPVFPVSFVAKSTARRDIKIRVTYTDPTGSVCTAECTTTSVDLTLPHTPRASITVSNPAATVQGAGAGAFVTVEGLGVDFSVTDIEIKTDPVCAECCEMIKVGFIQNVLSTNRTGTYSGGGTVSVNFPAGAPILDAVPADKNPPFYPYPQGSSNANFMSPNQLMVGCNTDFDISMVDFPAMSFELCRGTPAQRLTGITMADSFRLWLVAECPRGSGCYKSFHSWTWNTNYTINVTNVNCNAGTATVAITSSSVNSVDEGAQGGGPPAGAVTSGPVANDNAQIRTSGF